MTTTLTAPSGTAARISDTDVLRYLVRDAVSVAADDEPGTFSSRTPAGHALLSIAALARRAAGTLGADAGAPLRAGPAVLVQREIAAAARLLDAAAEAAGPGSPAAGIAVAQLVVPARRLRAQLHEAIAATSA